MLGHHGGQGEEELQRGPPLCGAPELHIRDLQLDGSALLDQLVEPGAPILHRAVRRHGHKQVVELVRVARVWPDFLPYPLDRVGVEPGQIALLHR